MKRERCDDCDQMKEPYRPVRKNLDGTIAYVCARCWHLLDYATYMYPRDTT